MSHSTGRTWRVLALAAFCAMVVGASGCTTIEDRLTSAQMGTGGLWSIRVDSSAFKTNKPIPRKYTADGENISPPLQWADVPPETVQLALIVEDPDAAGKHPAVHWLVYSIPYGATGLKEGAGQLVNTDVLLVQGKNSFGKIGYTGPMPPKGQTHRYYFQVYALDERIDVPAGVDAFTLMDAIHDHVLAKGFLMGTYTRPK